MSSFKMQQTSKMTRHTTHRNHTPNTHRNHTHHTQTKHTINTHKPDTPTTHTSVTHTNHVRFFFDFSQSIFSLFKNGALAICFSHIRQGGDQDTSPLILRLVVPIDVERAELFQLSIPVFVSTIFSVSSNNVDAVVKFLLELVVLVRRIIYLSPRHLFRQVICALGVAGTLNGLTRLFCGNS